MARRRSLTERVVWAVTATVALLVGLQSVLAYVAMHAQEDDLSESMLQREVQQIIAHIIQPGLTPTGTLIDSSRVSAWLTRDNEGIDAVPGRGPQDRDDPPREDGSVSRRRARSSNGGPPWNASGATMAPISDE